MSTANWRKNTSVIELLQAEPGHYSFTQAMRLIERAAYYANVASQEQGNPGRPVLENPVGDFLPPTTECVRFKANQTLSFPKSVIEKVEFKQDIARAAAGNAKMRWEIVVNFLGLTGATGVLPFHYTELIFERLKLRDESLNHFFNLFNHRATSLFYKATYKYRLPLQFERHKITAKRHDKYDGATHTLLSLMGLGTGHLVDGMSVPHESLIHFAGFFCQQVKTASALKQMTSAYFGVPITIEEMRGEWHELIDDVRTRLPHKGNRKGQNVCLGRSAIMGRKGWFAQGKTRVIIGPLDAKQFERFGPGTDALKQLNDMVKLYAGSETEFDYRVQVKRANLPPKIQLKKKRPPTLGWDTWLASKGQTIGDDDMNKTLDISATPGR